MNKDLYILSGRRFVRLPNHVGEFVNKKNEFTKERQSDSVGLCILQNGTKCTIAEFSMIQGISWYDAMKRAEEEGKHLPTQAEVIALKPYNDLFGQNYYEWLQEEYSSSNAWSWYWHRSYSFASFYGTDKSNDNQDDCARFFYDIEI